MIIEENDEQDLVLYQLDNIVKFSNFQEIQTFKLLFFLKKINFHIKIE